MVETLKTWLAQPGAALLDMRIDREEKVLPIVPAGRALDEMIS